MKYGNDFHLKFLKIYLALVYFIFQKYTDLHAYTINSVRMQLSIFLKTSGENCFRISSLYFVQYIVQYIVY